MPGKPPEKLNRFPSLSFGAEELLRSISDGRDVIEFGSGGSTLWFARFVNLLVSVETDPEWYARLLLEIQELKNVALLYVEDPEKAFKRIDEIVGAFNFDVFFVDSYEPTRRPFLLASLKRAKIGAYVVADDAHFPSVAKTIKAIDRKRFAVEILNGSKPHPIEGAIVPTKTAFMRRVA